MTVFDRRAKHPVAYVAASSSGSSSDIHETVQKQRDSKRDEATLRGARWSSESFMTYSASVTEDRERERERETELTLLYVYFA